MELTFAHWVYAFFIVVVLVTMAMRRETPIVCIAASFVLAWVVTGSFVKAVQAVFNSLTVAFTELLGIIAIISIIASRCGNRCMSKLAGKMQSKPSCASGSAR